MHVNDFSQHQLIKNNSKEYSNFKTGLSLPFHLNVQQKIWVLPVLELPQFGVTL